MKPQVYARVGGALYLFIILAGIYGEVVVRASLVVAGNSAATAQKIIASEFLFRTGIVGDLLMHVCDVPLTLILYLLLRPVNQNLSLLAGLFSMLQTAILCAHKLNLVAVVLLLGNTGRIDARERDALVSLYLALHEYGFGIGLLFFGVSCLVVGSLIYRSQYLPRALGALQLAAGVCYLVNSLALLLKPALADALVPWILLPAFVGELGTALWLLIKGVDMRRWAGGLTQETELVNLL